MFLTLLLVTFAIYVRRHLLLVFFVFALIAYVVVRGLEPRRGSHA